MTYACTCWQDALLMSAGVQPRSELPVVSLLFSSLGISRNSRTCPSDDSGTCVCRAGSVPHAEKREKSHSFLKRTLSHSERYTLAVQSSLGCRGRADRHCLKQDSPLISVLCSLGSAAPCTRAVRADGDRNAHIVRVRRCSRDSCFVLADAAYSNNHWILITYYVLP